MTMHVSYSALGSMGSCAIDVP
eukprot:COSAG01_NODE_59603_length_299_cov_1.035000_2_plen_21_part_01